MANSTNRPGGGGQSGGSGTGGPSGPGGTRPGGGVGTTSTPGRCALDGAAGAVAGLNTAADLDRRAAVLAAEAEIGREFLALVADCDPDGDALSWWLLATSVGQL